MLASTHIPIPKIIAATPGRVSVKSAHTNIRIKSHVCTTSANPAKIPGIRYIAIINITINTDAMIPASIACSNDCLPSVAPTLCEYFSVNLSGNAPKLI
ncbi:hypothetical protein D3C77_675630 [compost metagenome]